MGGKVKEGLGNLTGDAKLRAEGKGDLAEGMIQKRGRRHQGCGEERVQEGLTQALSCEGPEQSGPSFTA